MYFFFFNDTATTEIYTLSLHDAPSDLLRGPLDELGPEGDRSAHVRGHGDLEVRGLPGLRHAPRDGADRKSTRLNSSHANISYAVFCLKKNKKIARAHS